ncbi:hypothetical protein [Streptomyces sp. NPDC005859]|uniref:hypothetical protein n=1 Tax=Streptomyces sp. NPDC005859 TaxID=3157170 RepID=UPI003406C5CD
MRSPGPSTLREISPYSVFRSSTRPAHEPCHPALAAALGVLVLTALPALAADTGGSGTHLAHRDSYAKKAPVAVSSPSGV